MPVLSKVDLNVRHVTTAQPPCFLEATTDGRRGVEGASGCESYRCYLDDKRASCCLSAECPCSQKLVLNSGKHRSSLFELAFSCYLADLSETA